MNYQPETTRPVGEDYWHDYDMLLSTGFDPEKRCWHCNGAVHLKLKYCTTCGRQAKNGFVELSPGRASHYHRLGHQFEELDRHVNFKRSKQSYEGQQIIRKAVILSFYLAAFIGALAFCFNSKPAFLPQSQLVASAGDQIQADTKANPSQDNVQQITYPEASSDNSISGDYELGY